MNSVVSSQESEPVNKFNATVCNAEFRFGTGIGDLAESEFGVTLSTVQINSQALRSQETGVRRL